MTYKIQRPVPTYYIPLSDKIERQLDNEWKAGRTKIISAQQNCPECGAEMYFDKGDSHNEPWWECPKGHGTFSREKLLKLGRGWHEAPDHTGKAPKHKVAADRAQAKKANNAPMKKYQTTTINSYLNDIALLDYGVPYSKLDKEHRKHVREAYKKDFNKIFRPDTATELEIPTIENGRFKTTENAFRAGNIVHNPRLIVTLFFDGKQHPERFGADHAPADDEIVYLIFRAAGLTLNSQNEFYKKHDVRVQINYIGNDGIHRQAIFKAESPEKHTLIEQKVK